MATRTSTAKPAPVTVTFVKEKDTPGTVRFAEVVPDDDVAKIRTLYLQKQTAKDLGFPETIEVTIAAA